MAALRAAAGQRLAGGQGGAHRLGDVTVVAAAGMISEGNKKAIEAAGLSFILGAKIPDIPYAGAQWRREHPDEQMPDGLILTQPRPGRATNAVMRSSTTSTSMIVPGARCAGSTSRSRRPRRRSRGRCRSTRNRFITLVREDKSVNRTLETTARTLAGWKGYTTNLPDSTPEFVIGAYHRLYEIEASLRMSKHDLATRPIYHHKRESIDAHLTIVFAALAISRLVEDHTGWSIRRFVRTARRYRTVHIRADQPLLTAEDPLPADLRDALALINSPESAH